MPNADFASQFSKMVEHLPTPKNGAMSSFRWIPSARFSENHGGYSQQIDAILDSKQALQSSRKMCVVVKDLVQHLECPAFPLSQWILWTTALGVMPRNLAGWVSETSPTKHYFSQSKATRPLVNTFGSRYIFICLLLGQGVTFYKKKKIAVFDVLILILFIIVVVIVEVGLFGNEVLVLHLGGDLAGCSEKLKNMFSKKVTGKNDFQKMFSGTKWTDFQNCKL